MELLYCNRCVRRFVIALGFCLFCWFVFAQERTITTQFRIGGNPLTYTGSLEGWNELQKQIKLNNLLCEIMTDEAHGLHPNGKLRLAKKLAKELEE